MRPVRALPVSSFSHLLAAYRSADIQLSDAVDGGAGAGLTATSMLPHLDGSVYAFEPFPGNHRFFADVDPRINLLPFALADSRREQAFNVGSTVSADSAWGQRGMEGYSSVGELSDDGNYTVQCVRADDRVPLGCRVDFIKLDLQGGEVNALRGMPRLLDQARFLWVEYTAQPGLMDMLAGFEIFDTEHMFWGTPTDEAKQNFDFVGDPVTTSIGTEAWTAVRRQPWLDYEAEFLRWKGTPGLIQTDLVCVPRDKLDEFERVTSP